MDDEKLNYEVASMWMNVFMRSSTTDDVERFQQLSNVTASEINLVAMAGNGKDMLLREFLEILKIPKSSLTSIINRLERKGFMKRVIHPKDKRSFGLELTDIGEQFLDLYKDYQSEMGAKILKGLDQEEKQQLFYLLQKITASVCVDVR